MESEERSKLQSLPFFIRHENFQLCLVFPFWKFSLFIGIPPTPPRVLTCSFNAQDCKPIVAGESLLIQQFVLEQWRGEAHFVSTGRVPRVAVCIHRSLTKQVRTMPNYLLWPRKNNIDYLWHSSKRLSYNWINYLSNTTIWWLDIGHLLHRYQLHVLALMAIFRLTDWQQTYKQLYFGMRFVYAGRGVGVGWG